jgi:outer membrane protein assembly factor BamE (lipoprotein component of BamABCDE complex)
MHRTCRRIALLACLCLPALAGCGALSIFDSEHIPRGENVDPDALAELVPGTSTRADATTLLGSPTAHASFDDNTWIYIGQVTHSRIARTPGVLEQRVVVLRFDPKGTLREVRQLNRKDAKQVAMAAGETPSPGSEASFMQQLLGNVGKFSPLGLPSSGGTGGAGGAAATSNTGGALP